MSVPTIIVAAAITQTVAVPLVLQGLECRKENADEGGEGRRLHAGRHERRDRRWRTFIDIGRPHVERHGRHLEPEPDEQKADRQQMHRSRRHRLLGHERPDAVEPCRPGQSIGEGNPIQKERARERTQQEIFQRRLGGCAGITANARQNIDSQRQHFERQKDHKEVGRRGHEHHAGKRKQHEREGPAARQTPAVDGGRRDGQ